MLHQTHAGGLGEAPSDHAQRVLEEVRELPRVLGRAGPARATRTLVFIGGLHGNEPAGVLALRRVFAALEADDKGLIGRVVGFSGNRPALAAGVRYITDDLNRIWTPENVAERVRFDGELKNEQDELRDVMRELEPILADGTEVSLVDLHSTSGGGAAFTSLDDTLANRKLAFALPVPHVIGLEEELAGTLVGLLNARGITAIGFESGQHLDPLSVDRAEAAIWITMRAAGVLNNGRAEVKRARAFLVEQSAGQPGVVEVLHRHPVHPEDGFEMRAGYKNFLAIEEGEVLAEDRNGVIHALRSGRILMPLYQGQGEDGFFIVQPIHYAWLQLSATLRRWRFDRLVHWLPGVEKDPEETDTFVVDRTRARWLALQVFHLLGYRRIERTERYLHMKRRDGSSG